jgi:hypothetical protein
MVDMPPTLRTQKAFIALRTYLPTYLPTELVRKESGHATLPHDKALTELCVEVGQQTLPAEEPFRSLVLFGVSPVPSTAIRVANVIQITFE